MDSFRKLNEFAPALTLLVLIAGFVWTAATRNAQFEVVTRDLAELTTDVEALQTDVRSVQETLPHMVSCMIDRHPRKATDSLTAWVRSWGRVRIPHQETD